MSHIIQCKIQHTPEAMERILQVVRVRGWDLNALQVNREENWLRVDLRLKGTGSINNLLKQLEKLIGMEAVHGLSAVAQSQEVLAVNT